MVNTVAAPSSPEVAIPARPTSVAVPLDVVTTQTDAAFASVALESFIDVVVVTKEATAFVLAVVDTVEGVSATALFAGI